MENGAFPWSQIQLDALASGELVYAMNEGWASLSEGVGYALCWIGKRAWDQAVCRSIGQRVLPRVETVLRQYGVTVSDRRYMHTTQPINAHLVLARLSYGDGLYYFEMSRTGRVHALAAQREGDRYHLFDCHYGHFRVEGLRSFAGFLDRFMRQADYGRVYNKGTTVAGAGAVARWRVLDLAAAATASVRPTVGAVSPGEQRSVP